MGAAAHEEGTAVRKDTEAEAPGGGLGNRDEAARSADTSNLNEAASVSSA